jgi:hypothetical protein
MDLRIRVQAAAIRTRLMARHSNAGFRRVLSAMTDAELVERSNQYHADAVAYASASVAVLREEASCTPSISVR